MDRQDSQLETDTTATVGLFPGQGQIALEVREWAKSTVYFTDPLRGQFLVSPRGHFFVSLDSSLAFINEDLF